LAAGSSAGQVSAAGNIDVSNERYVVMEVGGVVETIEVRAGDQVKTGDLLLTLDTKSLERAARQAELAVMTQRNALDQLTEPADAEAIEAAEAAYLESQVNLTEVLDGPSDAALASAQSNLTAAWARYNELLDGPSQDELTQRSASLRQAEIAMAEAQTNYNKIAWRNDVGMTRESAALQTATISYESAKAAYAASVAAADESDLQSALSAVQSAQNTLDDLRNSPTEAAIASAEARVASASASLNSLVKGASDAEIEAQAIRLEQSLIDLEKAYTDLQAANLLATVDGMVLAVNTNVGQSVSAGYGVFQLADTSQLELTIYVAEVDIAQVSVGQQAEIEIDAFPGQLFSGEVSHIEPASSISSGVVEYPITIRLTDTELDGVLPGMTAVATIVDTTANTTAGWMVPTSAIQLVADASVVTVVRGDSSQPISVTPSYVVGEWTMVTSPDLQAGDQVYGTIISSVGDDSQVREMIGPNGGGGMGGNGGGLGGNNDGDMP
jgi:multidrug resistance efflux pump